MSKIWEFFENLGEYVYVADAETHELIYMNKKTLKSYGFQSLEEIIGLKCYEILQGNSLPCGMCNNEQLKPGFFKEWEYYNPLLRRELHIKDTLITDAKSSSVQYANIDLLYSTNSSRDTVLY